VFGCELLDAKQPLSKPSIEFQVAIGGLVMRVFLLGVFVLSLFHSVAHAQETSFRCHREGQIRSESDLLVVLDVKTQTVSEFSNWDEIETLFWSDEIVFWLAKGWYSNDTPQFALVAFFAPTAQLSINVANNANFGDGVVAMASRRERAPLNCYRVGIN
jgi:hypothetical protein